MRRLVEFSAVALAEAEEAATRYARERAGLGRRFAAALEARLDGICENPGRHRRVEGEIRMAVLDGFPYVIFYHEEPPSSIIVHAVFHTSRDPKEWQRRVRS